MLPAEVRENLDPDLVQIATTVTVGRGDYLFRAGDSSSSLFIVLEGELEVLVGEQSTGETVVASVGPGHLLGELEAISGTARVASVLAMEESTLLEIGAGRLEAMLVENRSSATQLLRAIARSLARRLTAASERLTRLPEDPVSEADLDVLDRLWS